MTVATRYLGEHLVLFLSRFSALQSWCIWSAPPAWSWPAKRQHCGEARDRIHPVPGFLQPPTMSCDTDRACMDLHQSRPVGKGHGRHMYVCVCMCANSKEIQTDHWRRRVSEDSGDGEQAQAAQTPARPHCFHPHPPSIHPQHTSSSLAAALESQPPLTPTTPIGPIVAQHPRPGTGPHLRSSLPKAALPPRHVSRFAPSPGG